MAVWYLGSQELGQFSCIESPVLWYKRSGTTVGECCGEWFGIYAGCRGSIQCFQKEKCTLCFCRSLRGTKVCVIVVDVGSLFECRFVFGEALWIWFRECSYLTFFTCCRQDQRESSPSYPLFYCAAEGARSPLFVMYLRLAEHHEVYLHTSQAGTYSVCCTYSNAT